MRIHVVIKNFIDSQKSTVFNGAIVTNDKWRREYGAFNKKICRLLTYERRLIVLVLKYFNSGCQIHINFNKFIDFAVYELKNYELVAELMGLFSEVETNRCPSSIHEVVAVVTRIIEVEAKTLCKITNTYPFGGKSRKSNISIEIGAMTAYFGPKYKIINGFVYMPARSTKITEYELIQMMKEYFGDWHYKIRKIKGRWHLSWRICYYPKCDIHKKQ
jgi:hypothetical protein